MPSLSARSGKKRSDPQLWRHQPDQTPGKRRLEGLAVEVLFLRRMERHHPAGVIDGPIAVAAASRNRTPEGVLERAAFEGGIDPSLSHGPGEIWASTGASFRRVTRATPIERAPDPKR